MFDYRAFKLLGKLIVDAGSLPPCTTDKLVMTLGVVNLELLSLIVRVDVKRSLH
jgi:hypothetical protein